MTRSTRTRPLRAALALLAVLALAHGAGAATRSESKVKLAFDNTGVQPAAEGVLKFEGKPGRSKLAIKLTGLDPSLSYSLLFNGTEWAAFGVEDRGKAELEFESEPSSGDPMLPGDPRGGTLVVSDGSQDVLSAVVSGPGEPAGTEAKEKGSLDIDDLPSNASVSTSFQQDRRGERRFDLSAQKLPAGAYMVLVDGELKDASVVNRDGGSLRLRFSSDPGRDDLDLDFDPRSSVVEIEGPSGMAASGSGEASIEGLDLCTESEVESPLDAVAGVGQAHSKLKVDDDCDRDFEVEIEDVPAGAYDVYVDGILRGTIQAAFDSSKGEVEGELQWDNDPDDPGELLLDFNPEGALVEVMQGATLFFAGFQLPPAPASAGGGGGLCTETKTTVALTNQGVLPAADAKAEFDIDSSDCEQQFEVEIEHAPPGTYDLYVGGVLRGQIAVGASGEGQIEFETDPDDPSELPLTFDPRGQNIQVFDGGTLLFERAFPG